jgi:hypothetical protein
MEAAVVMKVAALLNEDVAGCLDCPAHVEAVLGSERGGDTSS